MPKKLIDLEAVEGAKIITKVKKSESVDPFLYETCEKGLQLAAKIKRVKDKTIAPLEEELKTLKVKLKLDFDVFSTKLVTTGNGAVKLIETKPKLKLDQALVEQYLIKQGVYDKFMVQPEGISYVKITNKKSK